MNSVEWDGDERRLERRMERSLSKTDLDYIAMCISKDMKTRFSIPSEVHKSQHDWIQVHIEREKCRNEACKAVTRSVIQWSVLGLLSSVVYFFTHGKWPV